MSVKLALEGGRPVRDKILNYGRQTIEQADLEAVQEALYSDFLTTGPKVSEFEAAFAEKVGAKHAIAVNNGTAALHSALHSIGITENTEVITTPLTFAATANAVRYLGGKPIFVDIRPDTYNIDPSQIEKYITDKTRAIIPVDYAGHPADLDEIKSIAKRYNLAVIEDAAHALGATYKNKKIGSCADLTTFSFHPVKHITTGEGGMITTEDTTLANRLRIFRTHGISSDYRQRESSGTWIYDMAELGFNYRLTDLQSALGSAQLKRLDDWVKRRKEIASQYTQAFKHLKEITVPTLLPDCDSSWHLYVIQCNLEYLKTDRQQIFKALRAENIGVNVHYILVPKLSYYQKLGYHTQHLPIAESIYDRIISLPIWPGMTDRDIKDTIEAVHKVIEVYRK